MYSYPQTAVCLALVATIAAVLVSGCTPTEDPNTGASAVPSASGTAAGADLQQVSLRVPTMHCPFACWPKVKETLENQQGVAEVTLAEQAQENELDNPVVHVRVEGEFDASSAIEALAKVGFKDAALEN